MSEILHSAGCIQDDKKAKHTFTPSLLLRFTPSPRPLRLRVEKRLLAVGCWITHHRFSPSPLLCFSASPPLRALCASAVKKGCWLLAVGSPTTVHSSLFTVHSSLFTVHSSLFIVHSFLFPWLFLLPPYQTNKNIISIMGLEKPNWLILPKF